MRNTAPNRGRFPNLGDVADQHWDAATHGHDGRSQIVNSRDAPDDAHAPLHCALHHDAARRVLVALLNRVLNLGERDVPGEHPIGIDLHLELAEVAAQTLDSRHPRHGQQPVLDVELREIAQGHQVGCARFSLKRELENLVQSPGQARDQRRLGAGRQLRRALLDALGHELT